MVVLVYMTNEPLLEIDRDLKVKFGYRFGAAIPIAAVLFCHGGKLVGCPSDT